ncbi:uncharacterized protein LOC135699120 [Ochlerotatus camptorhynchus]|uniref:uncharacterized protein LOC135699120 n=1 Tax=Ochlerotatus camptorhynchus TaxID=644619 RepID=UPI0031D8E6D0
MEAWQQEWFQSRTTFLRKIKETVRSWLNSQKYKDQWIISRLRTGHARISCNFRKVGLICASVEHVLCVCPEFQKLREQHGLPENVSNLLGYDPSTLAALIAFLKDAHLSTDSVPTTNDDEIIQQLKEKFLETHDNNEKYRILTTLPRSWSAYKITKEFGVSQYMVDRTKTLQENKEIMTTPGRKLSRASLAEETLSLVREFYISDEISRACPGKRDYVITKSVDGKVYIQRRLVLCNLQEVYAIFKDKYPATKIGFSMFASKRPKHCILAGTSSTHTVCMCVYHQNVKLIFKTLQDRKSLPVDVKSYHDLFFKILCTNPTEQCWLKMCENCPGIQNLASEMVTILTDGNVESLKFKQWRQTDRCIMDLVELETQEFIDMFLEKLSDLSPHDFIAEQQAQMLQVFILPSLPKLQSLMLNTLPAYR